MRDTVTRRRAAAAGLPAISVAALGAAAIVAAWVLQARGYSPCELCLKERIPYYAGIPLALLVGLSAGRLPRPLARFGYVAIGLLFAASAVLGAYHAGAEWKLWPGPAACSGAAGAPPAVGDFFESLKHVTVVRCDEAALKVLGLSLAAWNALLSLGLAAFAAAGWSRA